MRNAGSEGWIERVHIKRYVYRTADLHAVERGQVAHFDDFDAELFRLLTLMQIHGADADLDETLGCARFHDAREGAGVRQAIAFEFVVEVGMGIEVDDGEIGNAFAEGTDDRQRDGMIAAEADGPQVLSKQLTDS